MSHTPSTQTTRIPLLVWMVPAVFLGLFPVAWVVREEVLAWTVEPLASALEAHGLRGELFFPDPAGLFMVYLRQTLTLSVVGGAPLGVWGAIALAGPGRSARHRHHALFILCGYGWVLFLGQAAISWGTTNWISQAAASDSQPQNWLQWYLPALHFLSAAVTPAALSPLAALFYPTVWQNSGRLALLFGAIVAVPAGYALFFLDAQTTHATVAIAVALILFGASVGLARLRGRVATPG